MGGGAGHAFLILEFSSPVCVSGATVQAAPVGALEDVTGHWRMFYFLKQTLEKAQ